MGLGNIVKGVVAQITPSFIDHGKTYSSYNPARRKPQPGEPGYVAPVQAQAPGTAQQNPAQVVIKAQRPENLFAGLNSNLQLPGHPINAPQVNKNVDLTPLVKPQPGAVIQPSHPATSVVAAPKPGYKAPTTPGSKGMQDGYSGTYTKDGFVRDAMPKKTGFLGHIRNGFKTAGKTAVGSVENLPEVALATARAGTGIVEGVGELPHVVTAGAATASHDLQQHMNNAVTRQIDRGFQDVNTGIKTATHYAINDTIDPLNRQLDRASQAYENDVPGAAAGASVYRRTQIPINVLAGLLTLGGSTAAEAGGQSGRVATVINKFKQLLNKPLHSNADNVVAKTGQAISNKTTPVVQVLNSPFSSGKTAISKFIGNNRNVTNAERELVDAGETGNVLGDAGNSTQVPVGQNIEVTAPASEPVGIPVTNNTPTGTPIREIGGDTPGQVRIPTAEEAAANKAASRFEDQAPGRPDQRIEGVSKPNTGNTGVFTKAEIQAERQALDESLASGEISKTAHKAANKELDSLTAADEAPKGHKINVKSVDSISVQNDVPTGLPETPGTVRATVATDPNKTASQAAANAPVVSAPAPLPREVQDVLDNPKQFNKRQVAAARNQAKLAKAKAKADEATAAAMDRSLSAKPTSDKGFVDTGEYTKGRNGNVTQVTHRASEAAQGAHDTANLSAQDVLAQARQEINENGVVSPETTRNLKAIRDSGRFSRTSPEFKAVNDEYKNAISHHARALSMTDRTARTSASGDQLANRFVSKIITFAEDSGKLTDAHIQQVTDAENAFTEARDAANAAGERFKASGSEADFQAWKSAQQAAEKADRDAKITEYTVSKDVLKGNKSIEAAKAVQDAEKNAGVYSMDSIDANMLSGTGTMVRNFINTLFPRAENKLFGRITTRIVKPIATVGGSTGRGARIGSAIGKDTYKADIAARKEAGVGFIRRTVTAGNTIGERNIQATAYSKAFDHYKQILKKEGYTGKELDNRAEFHVRTDPDGLVAQYEKDALQANALSSLTHTKKIENVLADGVQKKLAEAGFGGKGQQVGRFGAKAITRVGLGFPTVIAKSLVEGLKRATVGIPEALWSSGKYMKTGNKDAYAAELAKAMQHAGSGGSIILLGHALGKQGVISGAYPSDPAERKRWEAEGRQENSINIGGQWFSIPGYLGGFALPLMLGATTANGNISDEASLKNAWSTVLAASPVDSLQSTLDIMTGGASDSKIKNAATSLVRAATPAGSFLAELAKLTDSTQNDTTTKDTLHNILDSVAAGIPGLNNKVNTIDKTDAYGNTLHNPNRVATVLGAQGSEQSQGASDVKDDQSGANDSVKQLNDAGVISNKTLMGLVDPKLAKKISSNQPLTPEEVVKVQKSVTKGVSATDDNNWRENGDYATDKAALTAKLQMLDTDPTAKNSEKDMLKAQITRDDVLAKNNIPYDALKLYQSTDLNDWRSMGDPESDNYDPDTYQQLWDIDNAFTEAGVSYKKGDLTKNKFSAKSAGKGRGGAGSGSFSSDFGTLKAGDYAPKVQNYATIDQQSGNMPMIQVVRPNIVHKIGASG